MDKKSTTKVSNISDVRFIFKKEQSQKYINNA